MPIPVVNEVYQSPRLFRAIVEDLGEFRASMFDPGQMEREHSVLHQGGQDAPVAIMDGPQKEITCVITRARTNDHALEDWWVSKKPREVTVQTLNPDTKAVSMAETWSTCKPKVYKQETKYDAKGNEFIMESLTLTCLNKKLSRR